jgi:hypothetical protein
MQTEMADAERWPPWVKPDILRCGSDVCFTPKADMTATNSGAAHPLPQQMINMLTVGAFGNDMAAVPSLVGLAAASSASSVTSQARTACHFRYKSCQ